MGSLFAQQVVVVNARSGVAVLTRSEVINIYLGRYRQFFNGLEAQPVDVVDHHPGRTRFYQALVGKTVAEINAYWARQVFSGRVTPPPLVASDEDVLKWVASHPGGIGFVDQARVDSRVRVVLELNP
jgi:ABC-type phosphate transport system substrate-binding protein